MRRWEISTDVSGRPRILDVRLYDRLAHLRAAASRHSNRWGTGDGAGFADALAVCQTYRRVRIRPGGGEEERPEVATIRFARSALTVEIVAHEVAHAVVWLYRLDVLGLDLDSDGEEPVGAHFLPGDERIPIMVGHLTQVVWDAVNSPARES